ncbi:MAG: DM13 domain-containing protein, partial [Actinomycetota bacterium]
FLRLENFESNNGPDLNVYLVNPDDPSDFVDLGDLKGNIGDQNYEIPADVDLDRYSRVSIWCVRFGVGFGQADLSPTA